MESDLNLAIRRVRCVTGLWAIDHLRLVTVAFSAFDGFIIACKCLKNQQSTQTDKTTTAVDWEGRLSKALEMGGGLPKGRVIENAAELSKGAVQECGLIR